MRNSGAIQACAGNDQNPTDAALLAQRPLLVVRPRSDQDGPWPARLNGRRSSVESYAHSSNVACRYELRLQITHAAWLQLVAAGLAPQDIPFDVEIIDAAQHSARR